ncbi:uncharacterized protein GGS22DRAFT_195396 [Annulohypoxylon maeteangense]|uniref:uncharacterized protein n=1 Tax=Annulohypoxylon maeteangense TaxID=1927788 RepID=UPI002008DE00|nr:uncharacterized protein GGS22DRAFT_195396 [Annulohypoxylon maeteangense]KAI0883189.1 hypothetical protein GGS22DRAFT_195396 [Annulohypoxylon maeteangense]
MPLFPVSPNIQESASRKRTHEEFIEGSIENAISEPSNIENLGEEKSIALPTLVVTHHPQLPIPDITMDSTPASSPVDLTDPGSTPPVGDSPSPNKTPMWSPSANKISTTQSTQPFPTLPTPNSTTINTQPAKRKLTAAEKEKERAEKRQKKEEEATQKQQKRDAEAAEKAKKKAAEEATKAAKAAEKEEKEAARLAKKAEYEAKKREREEKEAKRAEEKRKKEEQEAKARQKQEKQKSMLAGFIIRKPTTTTSPATMSADQTAKPSGPNANPTTSQTEPKQEVSAYERTFKPFFVKDDVKLAPRPFEMDEEAQAVKSGILDEYVRGERGEFNPKPFNPSETFNLAFIQRRGKIPPNVRKIMEGLHGDPAKVPFGMTAEKTESQIEKLTTSAQSQLDTITMKRLSFYEDVRPPYFGTATTPMSRKELRQLSRRPTGRVLPLNYDYDSEAEWVEDEDGEDLDDDEDDEESNDGDGEMEDFLDDSEDHPTTVRPTFLGETEPVSTGICYEDENGRNPLPSMNQYRMEFLIEGHTSIDPFSTEYWPSSQGKKKARAIADTLTVPTSMPPPNAPADAFPKLTSTSATSRNARAVDTKDLVPNELMEEFKQAITSEELREFTKGTIVEMLAKKFTSCTKAQVKTTLDKIAHRISVPGAKKTVKVWALLPEPVS